MLMRSWRAGAGLERAGGVGGAGVGAGVCVVERVDSAVIPGDHTQVFGAGARPSAGQG